MALNRTPSPLLRVWVTCATLAMLAACGPILPESQLDGPTDDVEAEPTPDPDDGDKDDDPGDSTTPEDTCSPPFALSQGYSKRLRAVYLVPSDRVADPAHIANIKHAVSDVQEWFYDRLGAGKSFVLGDPVVEVVHTSNPAAYYDTSEVSGYSEKYYFWANGLRDAFSLTGANYSDEDNIWLFFLAADIRCQSSIGAVDHVALFSIRDLQALSGDAMDPQCTYDEDRTRCGWVGGIVRTILTALAVPDPADCVDEDPSTPCPDNLITEWDSFADAQLSEDQRQYLLDSGFPQYVEVSVCLGECEQPVED